MQDQETGGRCANARRLIRKPPSDAFMSTKMAKTLYDKIWDAHLVDSPPGETPVVERNRPERADE